MKFNLSEKIYRCDHDEVIHIIEIKEFIKLLKRDMHLTRENANVIYTLAGDKLT